MCFLARPPSSPMSADRRLLLTTRRSHAPHGRIDDLGSWLLASPSPCQVRSLPFQPSSWRPTRGPPCSEAWAMPSTGSGCRGKRTSPPVGSPPSRGWGTRRMWNRVIPAGSPAQEGCEGTPVADVTGRLWNWGFRRWPWRWIGPSSRMGPFGEIGRRLYGPGLQLGYQYMAHRGSPPWCPPAWATSWRSRPSPPPAGSLSWAWGSATPGDRPRGSCPDLDTPASQNGRSSRNRVTPGSPSESLTIAQTEFPSASINEALLGRSTRPRKVPSSANTS